MVQLGLDLHPEAKLVKHRTQHDAVDDTKQHENEDLDGETDEKSEYPEAARIPKIGGAVIKYSE